jgi:hypothetical protein
MQFCFHYYTQRREAKRALGFLHTHGTRAPCFSDLPRTTTLNIPFVGLTPAPLFPPVPQHFTNDAGSSSKWETYRCNCEEHCRGGKNVSKTTFFRHAKFRHRLPAFLPGVLAVKSSPSFPGERDDGGDDTIDAENAMESDHAGDDSGDDAIHAENSMEGDDVMQGDHAMEANIVMQGDYSVEANN